MGFANVSVYNLPGADSAAQLRGWPVIAYPHDRPTRHLDGLGAPRLRRRAYTNTCMLHTPQPHYHGLGPAAHLRCRSASI